MAVKEINIAFATPVSILIENAFSTFNFQNAPLNWSEVTSKFLQPVNHHIRVEVTGKRVSRSWRWIETRSTCKLLFMEMQEL